VVAGRVMWMFLLGHVPRCSLGEFVSLLVYLVVDFCPCCTQIFFVRCCQGCCDRRCKVRRQFVAFAVANCRLQRLDMLQSSYCILALHLASHSSKDSSDVSYSTPPRCFCWQDDVDVNAVDDVAW